MFSSYLYNYFALFCLDETNEVALEGINKIKYVNEEVKQVSICARLYRKENSIVSVAIYLNITSETAKCEFLIKSL